jgi:hypothetical protein
MLNIGRGHRGELLERGARFAAMTDPAEVSPSRGLARRP